MECLYVECIDTQERHVEKTVKNRHDQFRFWLTLLREIGNLLLYSLGVKVKL